MDVPTPPPPVLPPPPPAAPPPLFASPAPPASAPAVLLWYRVYLGGMAAIYAGCLALGIVLIWFREEIADWPPRDDPRTILVYGIVLAAMGALLHSVYFTALFLPRRPWAWIVALVLIALGLTSCCTMPASIPLLVYWLKPETQAWFGRRRAPCQA